jgi:hypothetical protein
LDEACGTCSGKHHTSQCNNPEKKFCVLCNSNKHTSWDRNCLKFLRRKNNLNEKHPENNLVYFPTNEEWTLTMRPDRIPLEEQFPSHFAVNSVPIITKKPHGKGKKLVPTKPITPNNTQGKSQHTINQYFSCSQNKGKEKESIQEEGELLDTDEYDDCFDNIENNDVKCLIGSTSN